MYALTQVGFRYGVQWVLREIDLTIERGEILGIVGPNGSGKTTLLKILAGLLKPQTGRAAYGSRSLSEIKPGELARRVSLVPQEHAIVFPYSVSEVVLMGRYPYLGGWAFETAEDVRIARNAMERMEVDHLAARMFNELSGGERQRVVIARALAQTAEAMLLDEPTAFLDLEHQAGIARILKALNEEDDKTLILVSHDLNLASHLCGRLVMLKEGRIARVGSPSEVLTEAILEAVYGCRPLVDRHPVTGRPRVTAINE